MNDNRDILYAIFYFALGVTAFFWGFMRLRRKRLIENIPTSTIRGLALGLVEITGKAEKTRILKTPFSSKECVFYRYTVERYEKRGKSSSWIKIAHGNSFYCPFWLNDGTGKIMVFPETAELILPIDYEFKTGFGKPLTPELIDFMEKQGLKYASFFGNYPLRFREWYIEPEQTTYVLGTAKKSIEQKLLEEELKLGKTEGATDVIIGKGDSEKVFIISDQAQKDILAKLSWQALLGIWAGAALALIMLWYLLFRGGVFST